MAFNPANAILDEEPAAPRPAARFNPANAVPDEPVADVAPPAPPAVPHFNPAAAIPDDNPFAGAIARGHATIDPVDTRGTLERLADYPKAALAGVDATADRVLGGFLGAYGASRERKANVERNMRIAADTALGPPRLEPPVAPSDIRLAGEARAHDAARTLDEVSADLIDKPEGAGWLNPVRGPAYVLQEAGIGAAPLLATVASGPAAPATMGLIGGSEKYAQSRAEGVDPERALSAAQATGGVSAVTGALPVTRALDPETTTLIRRALETGGGMAAANTVNRLADVPIRTQIEGLPAPAAGDLVKQLLEGLPQDVLSGAVFGAVHHAGAPAETANPEALRAALAAFDPNAEHALVAPRAEAPVAPQPPSTNPRASMVSVPTREQVPPSGMAAMSPAVRALMPPEPVVPKQVVQDAPTHSVEESPPPDIPQSDLRDRVLSLRNEIGWDQRGGRAVGNEGGDIVGRSTWQAQAAPTGRPSEFWSARPVKWTPEHATAAFDKFEAGNPLGRRDQAIIDYAHKFAADRQQERQAADEDYIASLERDKQAHDEAQREAIKTAAAAPTEYPTVSTTKSMTLDPQARADQDFEQTLAEHAGEHKLTPEAVSDARARFRPVVPMDPVTGLHTRAGLVDSIKVAQNRAEQGEPATYVEVDARNLGGVNAKAGTEKGGNKYLRDMAGLIERAAKDAGGEALVTRKGGDEFGVVIVGAGRAAVEAAFAKARAEGEQYSIASGMHDAPHKKEGQAPGLGIHYGIADIEPGRDIGNIMSEADTLVERRKIGESYEQPSEIAAPGDVPRSAGKALDRPAGEVGANQIAGGRPAPGVEGQAAGRTAAAEPVANAQPPAPAGLRTPELPAGTEVASAAPERPAAPAAARAPTAAGTPPGRPDVPAARAEGEQAPAPSGEIGISNELTNESRAKRELAPLISSASATDREGWEAAGHRAAVDANHGRRLAAELAKNPRPTTQAETFDLLHEAVRLTDEHDAARAEAARTEGKSEGQIAADLIRLKDIEMQFAQNDVALRSAGTESGAAFRVRKLVSDLNYSVPKQIERMKIATGEEVSADTRAEIEALKAKIDEGNAEIARLTAAKSKPKAEKKTVDERAQERVRAQIKKLEDQIKQRKAACPL